MVQLCMHLFNVFLNLLILPASTIAHRTKFPKVTTMYILFKLITYPLHLLSQSSNTAEYGVTFTHSPHLLPSLFCKTTPCPAF